MKLLSQLTLGYCLLFCPAQILVASDTENGIISEETATSSQKYELGPEEIQYIQLECDSFANEDNISPEKRPDYTETCIDELSAAVMEAIENIKNKPEPLISFNKKEES